MRTKKREGHPLDVFFGTMLLAILTLAAIKMLELVLALFFGLSLAWALGWAIFFTIGAWWIAFYAFYMENRQKTR